jgi:thiamine-phosphate diphosphorylase
MIRRRFRFPSPLYAIVDPDALPERPATAIVRDIVAGGGRVVQLRAKHHAADDLLAMALEMRAILDDVGGLFIVNDRVDIALAAGAHGVHLGADDLPVDRARQLLGPDAVIGFSSHSVAEAVAVAARGIVDYLGFGPIFPTATKTLSIVPHGVVGLSEAARRVALPVVAIGGITEATAGDVQAAGAAAVAMISALARADAVPSTVRRILERLGGSL